MTCLVSAGYPVWYAYGVSQGVISMQHGLQTDLVRVSGTLTGKPTDPNNKLVGSFLKPDLEKLKGVLEMNVHNFFSLRKLKDLTNIKQVIHRFKTDESIRKHGEVISKLNNLEILYISSYNFAEYDNWEFTGMNNLNQLTFEDCSFSGDETLMFICNQFPNLVYLNLKGNCTFNDSCIEHFQYIQNLETIDISGISEDKTKQMIPILVKIKSLKEIIRNGNNIYPKPVIRDSIESYNDNPKEIGGWSSEDDYEYEDEGDSKFFDL